MSTETNGTANGTASPVKTIGSAKSAAIKGALIEYNNAMDALEAAETGVQQALLNIKSVAGVATIEVDNMFFQVRERRGKLYLCELTGKPKGRPVGSTKKKIISEESVYRENMEPIQNLWTADELVPVPESAPVAESISEPTPDLDISAVNIDSTDNTASTGSFDTMTA